MDTMLAGRFHLDSRKFLMEEVPVPVPGPGEVLVEVKAAGVCLSDLHLIDGALVPLYPHASDAVTIGHEVSGVIRTLGPGLKRGLTVGTRVTLEAGTGLRAVRGLRAPPPLHPDPHSGHRDSRGDRSVGGRRTITVLGR
ncbi:alcohol dehydrogenase catalytic domain-containing protein [Sphaerisporangium perillae]|uniref:alcohol dehydrogenase catalytic domain-containing protein n=1 Tax=Sphaerisporangium perillae TaxID=2935860 RepID=UPI00200EB1C5|nr:alcohol dehydrogenase catalytic domain-containing protein [Sphaerisporangium perillae]